MSRDNRVKRDGNFDRRSTLRRNAARSVVEIQQPCISMYILRATEPPKRGETAACRGCGFFVEPLLEGCFEKETRRILLVPSVTSISLSVTWVIGC